MPLRTGNEAGSAVTIKSGVVMHEIAAVIAALDISHNPASVHLAQRGGLPMGIPFLLRVAAGDAEAIEAAEQKTGRPARRLREAAGFFIEQVLLHPESDSYRVLGGLADTPTSELRRNMALLLSWLHPDVAMHNRVDGAQLDRSVFANRVTEAWEHLKTAERRAQYDRTLAEAGRRKSASAKPKRSPRPNGNSVRAEVLLAAPMGRAKPREDFITRLARFILGAPR